MVVSIDSEEQHLLHNVEKDVTFQESDGDDMLWGRRVARFFSNRLSWYSQHASIDEAWSYFVNVTLPRRKSDGKGGYIKAAPGTRAVPTALYPAWTTPQRALHDFGTGIAVYFATMRALILICFIAGVIYTPSFLYYGSDEYASDGQQASLTFTLRGSLMCPQTTWVPCPNCTKLEWRDSLDRIAFSSTNLPFVLKNDCAPLRWQEGANHLVVFSFLIAATLWLALYQTRMEREYDEDLLTASDFSIKVDNPPPDATDPEEWKEFFSGFDDCTVVYCTVALNNENLVKQLVKRRVLLQQAERKVKGSDSVPLREISSTEAETKALMTKRLQKNEDTCRKLLEQRYPTSAVFVTFDTEHAQRKVLETLTVGTVNVATNNVNVLPSKYLFRGNLVLDVTESVEPSAIRWQDLDETLTVKAFQRILTGVLTALIIWGGFFLVKTAFEQNVNVAAFSIVILNILVPLLFKNINRLEAHAKEGSYQASLYIKICTFRWINTAIITTIIKPFTYTIAASANGVIPAIHAVLKAEIMTVPVVHMCDFVGNIKRQILAPAAANQAAMNTYFRGSMQNLGEKYTNLSKVVFLCFFYAVIFPASFFYGAVAISVVYVTDKFLLMRSWGPMPELGNDVAKLSRRVFFPLALLALAIMSEFYWSAYPFDNLCDADVFIDSKEHPAYIGSHIISPLSGEQHVVEVTVPGDGTEQAYRYCDQDFLERTSALLQFFHEDKDDWMSDDQQWLTFLFGVGVVVVLAGFLLWNCYRSLLPSLNEALVGSYFTDEKDSGMRFIDQENISAYVPQVRTAKFQFPLLACDVRGIDSRHIGWYDPVRDYSYYNMQLDVEYLSRGCETKWPLLSVVKCWPNTSDCHPVLANEQGSKAEKVIDTYGTL